MKLPRAFSADKLLKRLEPLGYFVTRQTGSHVRLTTQLKGEHHVTIPMQRNLKIGTLNSVISCISTHMEISKKELTEKLFG